ncbi:MAG: response regulator [Anaerolinea sp.]|nr:response regulator [Anaerolinea sp.]
MTYSLDQALAELDHLSPSIYDIAVSAFHKGPQQQLALRWLGEFRNSDGSWGDDVSWQYRYLCTYAAALAFLTAGQDTLGTSIISLLPEMPVSFPSNWTINFGGQIVALDTYAQKVLGIHLTHPPEVQSDMNYDRKKWEMLVGFNQFYNPNISLAGFFGEWVYVLYPKLDLSQLLEHFQETNGSMSHSPSSSVFYLMACDAAGFNNARVEHLRQYVEHMNPFQGHMGTLDQAPYFAAAWLLLFTDSDESPIPDHPSVKALRDAIYREGHLISTAGDSTFPGDVDTTSTAIIALNLPTEERARIMSGLEDMFENDHYLTFRHERTSAVTTNVHAVAAWPENPHTPAILGWIAGEMRRSLHLPRCKWHLSPYYNLGEMARLFAVIDHPTATQIALDAGHMLLEHQLPTGGWGIQNATTEETCYAVLALDKLRKVGLLDHTRVSIALERAETFLYRHEPDYSSLWVGKSLYYVPPVERWLRHLSAKITSSAAKALTVLYVDDNPSYRLILDSYLSTANYSVNLAETAESALEYLEHHEPDLVILDLVLPGMSGYQAVGHIRQAYPSLPVVATTAFYDGQTPLKVQDHGFHGFLRKPFDQNDLLLCVHRFSEGNG